MSSPLPDTRTILAHLESWFGRLRDQNTAPLTGPTRDTDALLQGRLQFQDNTLFLYGYTVGAREHCFLYDTPWDERGRVPGVGPREWYDGLEMPRTFRVRHSVLEPDRHEILDPLLREMMKRTLRRLGTRPSVANPLTASARDVLAQFDRWEERLPLLRHSELLVQASAPEVAHWPLTRARFAKEVGRADNPFLPYTFDVGATRYEFALRLAQSGARMTSSDDSPHESRASRRAHLAQVRGQERGLRSLAGAQDVVTANQATEAVHQVPSVPVRVSPYGPSASNRLGKPFLWRYSDGGA